MQQDSNFHRKKAGIEKTSMKIIKDQNPYENKMKSEEANEIKCSIGMMHENKEESQCENNLPKSKKEIAFSNENPTEIEEDFPHFNKEEIKEKEEEARVSMRIEGEWKFGSHDFYEKHYSERLHSIVSKIDIED
jgi:hypothetical protein